MEKGKLIVIEGACDGMGKTTQYTMLKERLIKDGKLIVTHHFPSYDTDQGKLAQMYLQGSYGNKNELSPYFIHSLYAVDRAITWHTELKPQFKEGKTILLDRYTTSSLLYQSVLFENKKERKDFVDFVCEYEYEKLQIQRPDNIIFLHAPFDLVAKMIMRRKQNDGVSNDIHERDLEFMKKVYENAMFLADYLGWNKIECSENNEMKSIESIHDDVYQLVKKR